MIKILEKTISMHRNKLRVFLDGKYLSTAGFSGGASFTLKADVENKRFKIVLDKLGPRSVTNSKRNGNPRPVIDLKVDELSCFGDQVKVLITNGEILFVEMHTEVEINERESRFIESGNTNQPLSKVCYDFDTRTLDMSKGLESADPERFFNLQKSGVKAEIINFSGEVQANHDFYLSCALIKTLQPAALNLKEAKIGESLLAALTHSMNAMGYHYSEDHKTFISRGLSYAQVADDFEHDYTLFHKIDHLLGNWRKARIKERFTRASRKIAEGKQFAVTGLFHGFGVLCSSIAEGLSRSGLPHFQKAVVEINEKYFNVSLENNPIWDAPADEEQYAICMPIQNVDVSRNGVLSEVNTAGVPCEGSSISGRSKNKNASAEMHSVTGGCFIDWLHWQSVTNPIVTQFENVCPYKSTLSYAIIKDTLTQVFGYEVLDMTVKGEDFGALEHRNRLCCIGFCESLSIDYSECKPAQFQPTYIHRTLGDALEDIPQSDPSFKPYTYLIEKQERDIKAGKGFRLQWLDELADKVGVIGKGYQKARGTEPYLKHKTEDLARLFTPIEHCRVKQIPEVFVRGCSLTLANEGIGQSVIYTAFSWVGEWIGTCINQAFSTIKQPNQLAA